jgi:hypothetical protein
LRAEKDKFPDYAAALAPQSKNGFGNLFDFSFSPWAPLPGVKGLGPLNSTPMRRLDSEGKARPKIQGKLIF